MKLRPVIAAVAASVLFSSMASAQYFAKDAKFTIALLDYTGPGHIKKAKQDRDYLRKATGIKDEFILIHGENQSTIYYGSYRAIDSKEDPEEAARAQKERKMLVTLRVGDDTPFAGAVFVIVPTPDPQAPAEWDIRNARGVWSLEIASYKDHPERKQAAVDTVREFRKRGVDAYYFHGPTASSVLLGAFPAEAVEITGVDAQTQSAKAPSDRELLVLPFKPPNMPDEVEQADGTRTKIVAPTTTIKDPLLVSLMRQYRDHAVNGANQMRTIKDPATGQEKQVLEEAFLIDIRQIQKASLLAAESSSSPSPNTAAPTPDVVVPRQSTPGSSLKGIK